MKEVDFNRWALIAPNNDTGLGRMAQDMKAILPLGLHLVATSSSIPDRELSESREAMFSSQWTRAELEERLEGLQGIIFFERHSWHPELLQTARRMNIRSVCVPMWEWFRGVSPHWRNCDYFACPNAYCLKVLRHYGFHNAELIPWTLDLSRLPSRVVRGPARHFVHNAGLVDPDDRKGTHDALAAFTKTSNPELRLTVRVQKDAGLLPRDERIKVHVGNLSDLAELYATGEAFIQPSKLEGMGFMVLEAVASGLPVITLDAPPMNEWGPQSRLLAKPHRFRYPAYSSDWVEHSHLTLPRIADLTRKIIWASENDLESISTDNRAWAQQTFARGQLLAVWEQTLAGVIRAPRLKEVNMDPEPRSPCLSIASRTRRLIKSFTGLQLPFLRSPI